MKTFLTIISLTVFSLSIGAQTLFTVGNSAISKQEFLQNYNRNNTAVTAATKQATLQQNLDLYINYKLKVKAAYALGYDTLPNQREDLAAFKQNIQAKFLNDDKMMNQLTKEAFERMQTDVRVSHILVLFKNDSVQYVQAAEKRIKEAYALLQKGTDFATVAKKYSDGYEVQTNLGDLGYITPFAISYSLENVSYATPIGMYSQPIKTTKAYHILKVTQKRPSLGTMEAAQILIPYIPNSTIEQKNEAAQKINLVYQKLQAGEAFDVLAKQYSGDIQTANNGGLLQPFKVGKYEPVFENEFAKLNNDAYSKPFTTAYGWHILKRVGNKTLPKVMDKLAEEQVQQLINGDERKKIAEKIFIQNIKNQTNYKATSTNINDIYTATTALINKMPNTTSVTDKQLLFTINKKPYNVGSYWQYIVAQQAAGTLQLSNTPQAIYDTYVNNAVFEYYKNNLENYNPTYKAQVQEFKDGNLLFETMERQVWAKSTNDTAGLQKYYANNKNKYVWGASADAIIISIADAKVADTMFKFLQRYPQKYKGYLVSYAASIQTDSGRFELGNIPVVDKTRFSPNQITTPYSPNNDGNMVMAYIINTYPAGTVKTYNEAKGLVVNDYQQQLENDWIASLKARYKVSINNATWQAIKNEK